MNRGDGTLLRALRKHAITGKRWRRICRWDHGRLIQGIDSSHRTTSGRKYNKLLRLRFPRTKP